MVMTVVIGLEREVGVGVDISRGAARSRWRTMLVLRSFSSLPIASAIEAASIVYRRARLSL